MHILDIPKLLIVSSSNKSYTLPFAHRRNIVRLALNPKGNLLLSIDSQGSAILTNVPSRVVLYHFTFRGTVTSLTFAPSGRHFAVGIGRLIEVWQTPEAPDASEEGTLDFAPFVRHRRYVGHSDDAQSIEWSSDSKFFLSASKDLTARIWSLDPEEGFVPTILSGHRSGVKAAWFSKDQETIWTISRDGALFQWEWLDLPHMPEGENPDKMRWQIANRHFFMQNSAYLTCAAFHPQTNLLVAGFSNGIFTIHELPDFAEIQTLNISQNNIDFVTINASGEWLAFGSSKLGQLLVWEWQSESYVLKQQGHYDSMNSLVYSPDGQKIITCADDGKIKVWDVRSGFCIVTFTEHTSGVTACEFSKRGNVLFTSSLDGSVRAWDLIRYRNFRTFTAPTRLSFSCLAVDPSGEVVCAGSLDTDSIHIWSVQTGQLLDRLTGHEGPVSSLAFSPDGTQLVSGSWDNTVRLWSVFARTQTSEPLQMQANVLALAYRPDSQQIVVSTLDGQVQFWSISEGSQTGVLDGRRDVSGGRKITDRRTAANIDGTKSFTTIRYSGDGTCVLAAGNSKYICLYECESGTLIKKFTVSVNLSIEGTQEFLNSKSLTEAGPRDMLDDNGDASDIEDRIDRTLPGSKRGDASQRRQRPEVRVSSVAFSPTGRSFCAATTEGLLVYSLDNQVTKFDPFDLDVTVTPRTTLKALEKQEYLKALVMALRLNQANLIKRVFLAIPVGDIKMVVYGCPQVYISRMIRLIAQQSEESPHLEFCLRWAESVLSVHGRHLKERKGDYAADVRLLIRAINWIERELRRLSENNSFMIEYLLSQPLQKEQTTNENGVLQVVDMDMEGADATMAGSEADGDDAGEWIGFA